MDIVQYMHGVVTRSLGIENDEVIADLLKQYYALSAARLLEVDGTYDSKNTKNHTLSALWGVQTLALARRLSRSFHLDESSVNALLNSITPVMMTEFCGLAGEKSVAQFIAQHFNASLNHLPSWSSQFVQISLTDKIDELNTLDDNVAPTLSDVIAPKDDSIMGNLNIPTTTESTDTTDLTETPENLTENPNETQIATDTSADDNEPKTAHVTPVLKKGKKSSDSKTKPRSKKPNTVLIALAAALVAVCAGGGAWYFLQGQNPPETVSAPAADTATPKVQNLNPPRLTITSGENGTLYACQAEVGSEALQGELIAVLKKSFGEGNVGCIMDIDAKFGSSMTGLERLESIIAMLKSTPNSSIEVIGDSIFVNSPQADTLPRLIKDIAMLAPQFKVSQTPALNKETYIAESLKKATDALNALGSPPNDYDLSRAMSLAYIDFNGTDVIPENAKSTLTLFAKKLSENPNAKIIIATHSNGGPGVDRMAGLSLTNTQAEAIRAFLSQNGVAPEQLIAKGAGDAFPIADNVTEYGMFKNRRTEFLVFSDATMNALNVDMSQMVPEAPTSNIQEAPVQMDAQMPADQTTPNAVGVESGQAPAVAPEVATAYPVQGMPNGNYTPETVAAPAYQPSPQPSISITQGSQTPNSSANTLPAELIEATSVTYGTDPIGNRNASKIKK